MSTCTTSPKEGGGGKSRLVISSNTRIRSSARHIVWLVPTWLSSLTLEGMRVAKSSSGAEGRQLQGVAVAGDQPRVELSGYQDRHCSKMYTPWVGIDSRRRTAWNEWPGR